MFKKEILLPSYLKKEFDTVVTGTITAANLNSAVGFSREENGSFGSCTSAQIVYMYDSTIIGSYFTIKFTVPEVKAGSVASLRFHLNIPSLAYEKYAYGSVSPIVIDLNNEVSELSSQPNYISRVVTTKGGSQAGLEVISCRRCYYPVIADPDDVSWIVDSEDEMRSLSFTKDPRDIGFEPIEIVEVHEPLAGFEAGKTYDFTLEYKIDAIITEDGVQTF